METPSIPVRRRVYQPHADELETLRETITNALKETRHLRTLYKISYACYFISGLLIGSGITALIMDKLAAS